MNRLGIFFFYDPQGIVDRYVDVMLDAFAPFIERLVVVANGRLMRNGRLLFKKYASDVLVRQNVGFDVYAYKHALEYIGWDEVYKYDELIMFNHTIFAPIFPLEEMFNKMDTSENVDFWGITKCHRTDFMPSRFKSFSEADTMPEHIQSHFIAVRGEMLQDLAFREHFEKMPSINAYDEANYFHEILFTSKFSDIGYCGDVYANSDFLKRSATTPILETPIRLLEETRCPIIKRKNFFGNFESYLHKTAADNAVRLLEYLKAYTNYDTDLIYENLIRTCSMGEFQEFFPLRHIVSDKTTAKTQARIGVIVSAGINNVLNEYGDMLGSFSGFSNVKVFIAADSDAVESIREAIEACGLDIAEILSPHPKESRDELVASVLERQADVFDYFCIVDYTMPQVHKLLSVEENVGYVINTNLIHSEDHINSIINAFSKNERLGLLVPPVPLIADYTKFSGNKAVDFFSNLQRIANSLGIIYSDRTACAILGSLWIRSKALQSLKCFLRQDGDISIFEHSNLSSLFGSALTLFAQAEGYATGIVYSKDYAENELKLSTYFINKLRVAALSPTLHLFGVADKISNGMKE